jgi:subtilisin family serine protease
MLSSHIHRASSASIAVLFGTILFTGCAETPLTTPADLELGVAGVDTSQIQDVRALPVPLPAVIRPWDTSRAAFVEIARAEYGYVAFGFKEPASARLRATGVRAAVSRATLLSGHRLVQERGARIVYSLRRIGAVIVQMDPEQAADLRDHPIVDYAEPRTWGEVAGAAGSVSSVRAFTAAMAQYENEILPWGVNMVKAPQAWDSAQAGGFGANVLIVDMGHQRGHPDLPVVPLSASNCGGQYGGCEDEAGHGTHVIGILTARANTFGVVGVAPAIPGISIDSWAACYVDAQGRWVCDLFEAAAGIEQDIGWADVVNLSLGTYNPAEYPVLLANAIAAALAEQAIVVAAAGNDRDNTLFWPAAQEGVIGVSGVRNNYNFASSSPCPARRSNWGPHVDLSAPFWALSTVPTDEYADETGTPTGSGTAPFWCGTSMAAPHVAGAAAILRGRYPDMPRQVVEGYLFTYALDRGPDDWDDHYGHGVVDVWNALRNVEWPPPPPPPFTVSLQGPSEVQPYATCLYQATNIQNGTPPFSYAWMADGMWVGSDSPYYYHMASEGDFDLAVRVSDADSRIAWGQLSVTVSWWASECSDT